LQTAVRSSSLISGERLLFSLVPRFFPEADGHLGELVEVVRDQVVVEIDVEVEVGPNRVPDHAVVRGDHEGRPVEEQEETDGFERGDRGRRQAAVKIVDEDDERDPELLQRRFEMVAQRLNLLRRARSLLLLADQPLPGFDRLLARRLGRIDVGPGHVSVRHAADRVPEPADHAGQRCTDRERASDTRRQTRRPGPTDPAEEFEDSRRRLLVLLGVLKQRIRDDFHQGRARVVVALVEPGVELHEREVAFRPLGELGTDQLDHRRLAHAPAARHPKR